MYQDIRVAWRFLLKRRTATAVAVLTLGVAVAVCTIAFGLVDQAFWRPLAFDRQEALVTVYNSRPAAPGFQVLSYPTTRRCAIVFGTASIWRLSFAWNRRSAARRAIVASRAERAGVGPRAHS